MNNVNSRNYGMVIGRLARAPKVYENRDGSHKVFYTLAAPRNFTNKEGKREADFVKLEAFLPAKVQVEQSVFGKMKTGELIAVSYTVRSSNYIDANGEERYNISMLTQDVELLESKGVAESRMNRNREPKGGEELPEDDGLPF